MRAFPPLAARAAPPEQLVSESGRHAWAQQARAELQAVLGQASPPAVMTLLLVVQEVQKSRARWAQAKWVEHPQVYAARLAAEA